MSVRNGIALLLALSTLTFLVACGSRGVRTRWGLRFGRAGYLGVLVCALAMGMTAAAMGQTGAEENAPPTTAKDGTAADQTASDKTASDKAATDKDKDKEK